MCEHKDSFAVNAAVAAAVASMQRLAELPDTLAEDAPVKARLVD
jgi:hypothetical protein